MHRCLLLVVLALGGCAQNLFYHPDRVLYDNPARSGLKFEQVIFPSRDGTRLVGWFIPASGYANPRNARGTIVHYHGNAQNLSAHWQFVEWLPKRGFNVFVFDYRGYGGSEGSPNPKGVFEDSLSALDYVRNRQDVDPGRLLVFGQSLGGANAIAVVGSGDRSGVKAVAVEAAFYSYSSIASDKVPGAGALMDDTYSPEKYAANLSPIPLLLVHGTADSVIPYAHAARIFEKARDPKQLVQVDGGAHIDAFTARFGDKYREMLIEFFEAAVSSQQN